MGKSRLPLLDARTNKQRLGFVRKKEGVVIIPSNRTAYYSLSIFCVELTCLFVEYNLHPQSPNRDGMFHKLKTKVVPQPRHELWIRFGLQQLGGMTDANGWMNGRLK